MRRGCYAGHSPYLVAEKPLTLHHQVLLCYNRRMMLLRAWLRLLFLLAWTWLPRKNRGWIARVMSNATTNPTEAPVQPTPRRVTLYLVRHGQTQFNVEHRLPGQLPGVTLNDVGRRQATELAQAMSELPLSAVVCSPLERARETAALIVRERVVTQIFDPRLMDTDVGPWAGQFIDDIRKQDPAWEQFVRHPTQPPPGVEGFYQVLSRVVAATEAARRDEALGNAIMIVAHADVIKLIIIHYLGLPIEGANWMHIPNASVTTLIFEGEHAPAVAALSWTPSPPWLKPVPPADAPVAAHEGGETVGESAPSPA